jgi:hypothetical protein
MNDLRAMFRFFLSAGGVTVMFGFVTESELSSLKEIRWELESQLESSMGASRVLGAKHHAPRRVP